MLSIIFLQPFHGVKAHKSLDKATPHWRNHKTIGDSDASISSAKKKHLLSTTLGFDGGDARKQASKGIKNMRPKQSIDDDENTTM